MDSIRDLGNDSKQTRDRDRLRMRRSAVFGFLMSAIGIGIALMVLAIVFAIVIKGAPMINWTFLTHNPEENMSAGGIAPMIMGSIYLLVGTLIVTLPLGVFGGIFLAEYAGSRSWVGIARALVTSLAGTPSIIYGLFGFAVFVLAITQKATLMAGILTLSTMAIPIVVLSTEAAIRAVAQSQVDGGYALGLTRWQVMWRVVLPQAIPGIMTGVILATGRAMGEAPPILLTAGIFYTTTQPAFHKVLNEPVMNLPYHLTEAIRQTTAFRDEQVWGTCLVLLMLMLVLNITAIVLRSRQRRHRI